MPTFLVYAHTDAPMVARLALSLAPDPVLVHVDRKTDIKPFRDSLASATNAILLDERVPVRWGAYSQVEAMRLLIAAGAAETAPDDYLVMLSGQDYPLRPISEFREYLENHRGQQFIKSFAIAGSEPKYEKQISRRHYRDIKFMESAKGRALRFRNLIIRLLEFVDRRPTSPVPANLIAAHGQTHWALTRECALQLDAMISPTVEAFFRQVFAPDEKVFHSLFASSRSPSEALAGGHGPYQGPGTWRYTNFHYIDPGMKKIFAVADAEFVLSRDDFFIRKVHSSESAALLDLIDQREASRSAKDKASRSTKD